MKPTKDKSVALPLTEATFLILLSLAGDAHHGYAIMKDVQRLSQGRITLSTGTLYGAIKRLQAQGLIERTESLPNIDHRRRKAYRLTGRGQNLLMNEITRMQSLIRAVHQRAEGEL